MDGDVEMLVLEELMSLSEPASERTPYALLGEFVPARSTRGETLTTREKETIDRDVEMVVLEELMNLV